jgi:16S rRNA (cytidine1402-2'-O)-methyltransferase
VSGTLFIVATPIGNLGDASERLGATLSGCDLVLCEDTRRTGKLLELLGLSASLRTCHEHDEQRRIPEVLSLLAEGRDVALVSDAGTPLVSDPGYRLVAAAHAAGHRVSPIPGPSSIVAALSACGLPTDRFTFEGFLPRKTQARRRLLRELGEERRTLVLLETPHRLARALADLCEAFGTERRACLCRELTKLHEEVSLSTLGALKARLGESEVKGEIVLVVEGAAAPAPQDDPVAVVERVQALIDDGADEKDALRTTAKETGLPKREVYRLFKLERPDGCA